MLKTYTYIILFFCGGSMFAVDTPMIQPGTCSIGKTIDYKNDGKQVGMFEVSLNPTATINVGKLWALVNPKDPKKRVYLGFAGLNRQSQIFRGQGQVVCLECSGSGAQDPNDRVDPCPDKNVSNYCVFCTEAPCKDAFSLTACQASGAEDRVQPPATTATSEGFARVPNTMGPPTPSGSIISRLGLVEPTQPAK